MTLFSKVLVANRGEIAVRIFRTLRELEIGTVAVYSEADRGRLHVARADEAYLIGPGPAAESYLRGDHIVDAALRRKRTRFIRLRFSRRMPNSHKSCRRGSSGSAHHPTRSKPWVPRSLRASGCAAGVPIIPGTTEPAKTAADALAAAVEIGFPVAIKASAGGGGKGCGSPTRPRRSSVPTRQRGGKGRCISPTRPCTSSGISMILVTSRCNSRRRSWERDPPRRAGLHDPATTSKLVEETPSPAVDAALRGKIGAIAVDAARAVGYCSAGTIEGLSPSMGLTTSWR